jgi:DNA-binding XRE family transcriptional regulator
MRVRSIADAAAAVRGRRQELDLSQDQVARRAGVSRKWVYEFEAGKPTAALGLGLDVGTERPRDAAASAIDLDALLEGHRRG